MDSEEVFQVLLTHETYSFYHEIARLAGRAIEDILSDTLFQCAQMIANKTNLGMDKPNDAQSFEG